MNAQEPTDPALVLKADVIAAALQSARTQQLSAPELIALKKFLAGFFDDRDRLTLSDSESLIRVLGAARDGIERAAQVAKELL